MLNKILILIFVPIWSSFWARVDGGGYLKVRNIIERTMCIAPFVIYGIAGGPDVWSVAILLMYAFIGADPGTYFSARQAGPMDSKPGFLDGIVRLFYGPDPRLLDPTSRPRIARVRLGMLVLGMAQMLGPITCAAGQGHFLGVVLFVMAGIGRMGAYMVIDTEKAEHLNGFQRGLFCAIAIITKGP